MLTAIPKRGRPPFDMLGVSELSRLGHDLQRNDRRIKLI
jgi:hypothetical protein